MENRKKRIGVIFGGKSGEHEVSLMSAASVIRVLNTEKYEPVYIGITKEGAWKRFCGDADRIEDGSWLASAQDLNPGDLKSHIDFALPILHGPYCEDGKIQGFFETMDIPYGGCGVLASAVAMDKQVARQVFLQAGLPMCRHVFLTRAQYRNEEEAVIRRIEEEIGYPNFVKPANLGSSVGISKAKDRAALKEALALAMQYDSRIIVEEFIDCRELETGILGNDDPKAAEVGEILSSAEFYDYEAKYSDGFSQICIPAEISEQDRQTIRSMAVKAFKAIGGEGYSRVDFFKDRKTGKLYLNEINTIPGFTKYSMFPLLWEAAGVSYSDIVERIIELGYERYHAKNHREAML